MINLTGTFDTTNALSSMFLWIIFGYLGASFSFIGLRPSERITSKNLKIVSEANAAQRPLGSERRVAAMGII